MSFVNGPVLGSYGMWNLSNECSEAQAGGIVPRVFNVCGYIPGVSVVSGVTRLAIGILFVVASKDPRDTKMGGSWIVRGFLESCQFGIPLAVADIMISSVRSGLCRKEKAAAL